MNPHSPSASASQSSSSRSATRGIFSPLFALLHMLVSVVTHAQANFAKAWNHCKDLGMYWSSRARVAMIGALADAQSWLPHWWSMTPRLQRIDPAAAVDYVILRVVTVVAFLVLLPRALLEATWIVFYGRIEALRNAVLMRFNRQVVWLRDVKASAFNFYNTLRSRLHSSVWAIPAVFVAFAWYMTTSIVSRLWGIASPFVDRIVPPKRSQRQLSELSTTAVLEAFYDANCSPCAAEMAMLERMDTHGRVRFTDFSSVDKSNLNVPGMRADDVCFVRSLVTDTKFFGTEAVRQVYGTVFPRAQPLINFTRLPLLARTLDWLYDRFLSVRTAFLQNKHVHNFSTALVEQQQYFFDANKQHHRLQQQKQQQQRARTWAQVAAHDAAPDSAVVQSDQIIVH